MGIPLNEFRHFEIPAAGYVACIADPCWEFETFSAKGQGKSASKHYDTMPTKDIIALRKPLGLDWMFAPDSVLFMWTTWSMLARGDAHAVMEGWGFEPKSGGSWHKITKHGKDCFAGGYILRDSCEPFLIGTRGSPERKVKNIRNGFRALRRGHSEKPDNLHRAIEKLYPRGPWLELFARQPFANRPGWTYWGNEAKGRIIRPEPPPIEIPPLLAQIGGLDAPTQLRNPRKG